MLRFNLEEARQFSTFGPPLFFFFAVQMLLRCIFSLVWLIVPGIRKILIWTDPALSLIFFSWAFLPLLNYLLNQFTL
jgi:ABC-type uncharacterized transport system permease subunit